MFFVISGFCIHSSFLRRQGGFQWTTFFAQRFWRIYPPYLFVLCFFAYRLRLNPFKSDAAGQFWAHAVLLHNSFSETFFGINASFWSIAVEVQLYLLYPLFLKMRSWGGIERALWATFLVGLITRPALVGLWGWPEGVITPGMTSPLMTWSDWALGAYVAECRWRGANAFSRHTPLCIASGAMLIASSFWCPATMFSFSIAAFGAAVLLDGMLAKKPQTNVFARTLAGVGVISYSLYLWHQPLLVELASRFQGGSSIQAVDPNTPAWIWLCAVASVLLLAWLSWSAIERSSIRLGVLFRRRFDAGGKTPISAV
jgi:peptidoglycan/LPS O-acetylase OafA/YrhL